MELSCYLSITLSQGLGYVAATSYRMANSRDKTSNNRATAVRASADVDRI